MPRVFVAGGNLPYKRMFENWGWEVGDTLENIDLLQFTGGADVDPRLYGEALHPKTFFDTRRDESDKALHAFGKANKIPMAGICRGAQFLHVMNGGRLWQDVDGHALSQGHYASCTETGRTLLVSSTHHQMMMENCGELLLCGYNTACEMKSTPDKSFVPTDRLFGIEAEAIYHKKNNVLCFQPHPEICRKESECQVLYFEYLKNKLGVSA